jgi:hypothetical protein
MHLVLDKNRALVDELVARWDLAPRTAERVVVDWQEGRNLRLKEAINEQLQVGADNAREMHRSVDGLGQCTQRLAFHFEDILRQIYGAESLKDDKWMAKLDRELGLGMKPHYDRKARVGVGYPLQRSE